MRRKLSIVLSLVLGAVLAVGVLVAAGLTSASFPFQTETVDRSQPVLLQSVQEISQFHAAVGTFEVILDQEEDVRWVPGFIAGERSLFVAAGTVNAYVDLSGLADGDLTLSEDGTTARIRLPEAQLDPPNLDHDRTYLYSQERGVINRHVRRARHPADDRRRLNAFAVRPRGPRSVADLTQEVGCRSPEPASHPCSPRVSHVAVRRPS